MNISYFAVTTENSYQRFDPFSYRAIFNIKWNQISLRLLSFKYIRIISPAKFDK